MATPRIRKPAAPRRRPRRREQEVLEAASRVFAEHGYTKASVQHVADELGILKGSLYYYIQTKEDLLLRLLEQVHDDVDELLLQSAAETSGRPPLERLRDYVRRQALHSVSHLARLSVYYQDVDQLSPVPRRAILDRRKPHEAYVIELIEQAQADGTADAAQDSRLLANCVFATIIWTHRWYRASGQDARLQAAEACAAYAVAGVAPHPSELRQ